MELQISLTLELVGLEQFRVQEEATRKLHTPPPPSQQRGLVMAVLRVRRQRRYLAQAVLAVRTLTEAPHKTAAMVVMALHGLSISRQFEEAA